MAFDMHSETVNGIVKITLSGELDASTAPAVMAEVQQIVKPGTRRLVFLVKELAYISSAGLRVLLIAKQQVGSEIYWVAPTEMVLDTLRLAGFDEVVKVREHYDAAEIEQ